MNFNKAKLGQPQINYLGIVLGEKESFAGIRRPLWKLLTKNQEWNWIKEHNALTKLKEVALKSSD